MYKSTNNGSNWTGVNNGLSSNSVFALTSQNTQLYVGTDSGLFITSDNGAHWIKAINGLPADMSVISLASSDSGVFAGTLDGTLYSSFDNGSSWTSETSLVNSVAIHSLATNDSGVYAGTFTGLYYLPYGDTAWTNLSSGFASSNIPFVVTLDSLVIAASSSIGNGIYFSNNNGKIWRAINSGFSINSTTMSLAASPKYVYAGVEALCVWRRSISEIMDLPESGLANDIEIFPNPATNSITIKTTEKDLIAEFSTLEGKVVLSGKLIPSSTIDIHSLKKGIYLVKLYNNQGVVTRKIIKQ